MLTRSPRLLLWVRSALSSPVAAGGKEEERSAIFMGAFTCAEYLGQGVRSNFRGSNNLLWPVAPQETV